MTRTSETVTLDGGESRSLTLTFAAEDADRNDADNATVTISDSPDTAQDTRDITIPSVIPDDKLAIGTDPTEDTVAFVPAGPIETDADTIAVETQGDRQLRDTLAPLDDTGDVETVETAFGAFRRINRGGGSSVLFDPPETLRPPFERQRVHPLSVDSDQVGEDLFEISMELGLDRPRPRDPEAIDDGDGEVVDSETVRLDPDETASLTLSFGSGERNPGDVTVAAVPPRRSDADTSTVTLTDADWTFAFGAGGTLGLSNRQVGAVSRESAGGVELVSLPLRLSTSQVRELLAAGSRVAAVTVRDIADGASRVRDTLPSSDATADVQTPPAAPIDGGTWALTDWSVERAGAGRAPWAADVTFAIID